MALNEFEFDDIIHLLNGEETDLVESETENILPTLQLAIQGFHITNLTQGPDPEGVFLRHRVDSINHTVIYVLHQDGQVRFSMENNEDAQKGQRGRGVLMVKFQNFQGRSNKSTMTIDGPWNPVDGLRTVSDMFWAFSVMGADKFTMHELLEGCRSWV